MNDSWARRTYWTCTSTALVCLLSACIAQTDDAVPSEDGAPYDDEVVDGTELPAEIGSTTLALSDEVEWHLGTGYDRYLMPISDGACFLTGVSGYFGGWQEVVAIIQRDGWWVLTGDGQAWVSATARCVRWSDFSNLLSAPSASSQFDSQVYSVSILFGGTYKFGNNTADLWNYASLCFMSRVQGNLNGGGESIHVHAGPDGYQLVTDNNNTRGSDYGTGGSAFCAFPGQIGTLALWHGDLANAAEHEEFTWSQWQGAVAMAPTNEAFCFLTGVQGRFMGGGESVRIQEIEGRWWLTGTSQQEGVLGRARCVKYRQSLRLLIPRQRLPF